MQGEAAMFGDPSWFRPKAWGWGLTPITWQGWLYALGWTAVLAAPFVALLVGGRLVEGFVWMGLSLAVLFYDVYLIRTAIFADAAALERAAAAETSADEVSRDAGDDDREYDYYIK